MAKHKAEPICTGCGKKLGIVKIKFDSIPGGLFCTGCARSIQKQIHDKKEGKD